MGAAAVLETPAATPDSMKFSKNPSFLSAILSSEGWSLKREKKLKDSNKSRNAEEVH